MQEVAKLRRSLDDAEGVSRDTKKEWAFLRSQNITLEEMNVRFCNLTMQLKWLKCSKWFKFWSTNCLT